MLRSGISTRGTPDAALFPSTAYASQPEMLRLRSRIMLKLLEKNMVRGEMANDSVTVT